MGFCNSCGRPIVKEDYGTNKDGSLNPERNQQGFTLNNTGFMQTMERSVLNSAELC